MSELTPIGSRLQISLDAEQLRMANEWFFKWHRIGRNTPVEIESFDGRNISLGGTVFWGSVRNVYWDTIQRYLRQKIGLICDDLETELRKYPVSIRMKALDESLGIVRQFAAKIRRAAMEKDRILRGNGTEFPEAKDIGSWVGSRTEDIEKRISTLRLIYCDMEVAKGGNGMALSALMNARVTLVKEDGTVFKENIPANVSGNCIITFDATLPLETGDHFLRQLPSGLVEDFVVTDPAFHGALGRIPASFQAQVRRSDQPAAQAQTIINNITNHVSGTNARVSVNSIDNSTNTAAIPVLKLAGLLEQVKPAVEGLPEPQRTAIAEPIALLESEIRSGNADLPKVHSALHSMRSIAEGATGNLVAVGIDGLIRQMLAGS